MVADPEWSSLDHLLDLHTVFVPKLVADELTGAVTYDYGAIRIVETASVRGTD